LWCVVTSTPGEGLTIDGLTIRVAALLVTFPAAFVTTTSNVAPLSDANAGGVV
jgi:hypothetical protein